MKQLHIKLTGRNHPSWLASTHW